MKDITDKQRRILDYIIESTKDQGYPPSVREIGEAVGLKSTSTVHGHLSRLEKYGYIKRDSSKTRAIEVMGQTEPDLITDHYLIPIVGRVAAGEPILAEENIQDYFPLPKHFVPHEDCFMLEVKGSSMINVGIFEGDYLLVLQQPTARNGEIVVALIEDGATVKTFYQEKNAIRLQPENDTMEPIIVHNDLTILGKVIGLYRRM